MKWIEWVFIIAFLMIGLTCLTMSATMLMGPGSFGSYFHYFLRICIWIAIPFLIALGLYILFKKKNR